MKKVVLLGGGNVAYHLAQRLTENPQYQLVQLYNRSPLSTAFDAIAVEKTTQLEALLPADIYILSVKDDAIAAPFRRALGGTYLRQCAYAGA